MALSEEKAVNQRGNLISQQLEDKEIQEILKSGTDLRQYSQQIEKDLKAVENQSIEEYIKESQNIACLHNQIGDCDSILERMESMLTNFQVNFNKQMSTSLTTLIGVKRFRKYSHKLWPIVKCSVLISFVIHCIMG